MGNIDLKQNRGVRTTDLPSVGISDTTAYAMRGMNALDRANDRLASGMKHVSDALFGVTKDMVATRDRVEADTAQIEIFKLEDADNKKMEADILAGRIKTPEQFEEAYNKLYASRESKINKYLESNVSSERNAEFLSLNAKGKSATNYAHMAGVFNSFRIKQLGDNARANAEECIAMGARDNMEAAYRAMGDVKDKTGKVVKKGYWSEEVIERYIKEGNNRIDQDEIKTRILEAESFVNSEKQKAQYEAIVIDLNSGKYKGLYKPQVDKLVASINKGVNASEYKNELRSCSAMFAKDASQMSQAQFDEWEKSSIADISAKKHLSKEDKEYWTEKISLKRKALQKQFVENAQAQNRAATISLLESAYKDERGDVDLGYDIIHGKERIAKRDKFDYENKALDNEAMVAYDKDFHAVMSDISSYKNEKDKDGIELRNLLFRTQSFTREHRKSLINAIYNKVNNRVPDKWSSESWDSFTGQIDSMFEWYDVEAKPADEKEQMAKDSKSVAFYQMRNSIMKDVETLGLTPLQAQEYLQKDPRYKRLCDKQSYSDAVDFLNGFMVNPVETPKSYVKENREKQANDLLNGMFGQYKGE